jgi:hypothetical protein
MARQSSARDQAAGRNEVRLVYDQLAGDVFIETFGNHDGVSIHTTVRLDKMRFVALVKDIGVL